MKSCLLAIAMLAAIPSAYAFEHVRPEQNKNTAYSGGATDWVGFAATPGGRVFQTDHLYPSEEAARTAARQECEHATARTCPRDMTISVTSDFDVVAFICRRGDKQGTYFGASKLDKEDDSAIGKAVRAGFSPGDCKAGPRY